MKDQISGFISNVLAHKFTYESDKMILSTPEIQMKFLYHLAYFLNSFPLNRLKHWAISTQKVIGGIHPRILKDLADAIVRLVSTIFEGSWESGEAPAGSWPTLYRFLRKARNMTLETTGLSVLLQQLVKL